MPLCDMSVRLKCKYKIKYQILEFIYRAIKLILYIKKP